MILNYEGQAYEITNWDEFQNKLLWAIGFQIESEIIKQINDLRLVDIGLFKRISSNVVNGELIITSDAPYAQYLEYGTLAYFKRYKEDSFPLTPYPKKKDSTKEARKKMDSGMQPFAPFRRVMWNQNKMALIIDKAVKAASQ